MFHFVLYLFLNYFLRFCISVIILPIDLSTIRICITNKIPSYVIIAINLQQNLERERENNEWNMNGV